MIFNQVLEQFGDWIFFWKDFKSWFLVKEIDLDFFVNCVSRRPVFFDHYERKKLAVEALLEEIGYSNIHLTSLRISDRPSVIAALVEANIPQMNLDSYKGSYPEFIGLVEHYHKRGDLLRGLCGDAFVPVVCSIEETLDRESKLHSAELQHRLNYYLKDLIRPNGGPGLLREYKLRQILKNLFNLYADMFLTRETERDFDIFSRLPLPRDGKELEKILKLVMSSSLTNDQMDEVGVFRTDRERMAFFVQENRRALKSCHPRFTWLYPKEYIQLKKYDRDVCFGHVEAFIMTNGHRSEVFPLIREEDPQLTYSFESLVECELLKKEFFHSISFFPEMKMETFGLVAFVFSTLREDLVDEFSKRLDDYLVALHRHLIGTWLIEQAKAGNYDTIEGMMILKLTPFSYNLLGGLFSILFLLGSRKIFRGGWWKGNVNVVSFIFNLIKEQSNIRAIVHLPLLFTVFIFILLNNLIGLLPFGYTMTSHILFTFFFGFSLLIGITILIWREKGKDMIQLFLPKGVPSFLVPFLFVIEVISYIFRTVSLSVRLFANMMAGHALLHILSNFGVVISSISSPLRFFYIFPLIVVGLITFLEVGIALLQAYVFTVLLAIYFNDVYSLESH